MNRAHALRRLTDRISMQMHWPHEPWPGIGDMIREQRRRGAVLGELVDIWGAKAVVEALGVIEPIDQAHGETLDARAPDETLEGPPR
jgi:hypothetical protein